MRKGVIRVKLTSKTNEADKLIGSQMLGTIAMAGYSRFFRRVESKGSVDIFIVEDL